MSHHAISNPLSPGISPKAVLALKRCIVSKFDSENWDEVTYLINDRDIINSHPKLLRSLSFGDDDYSGCVLGVLRQLIDLDKKNFDILADYCNLKDWLQNNDPQLFEELFGHIHPSLSAAEKVALDNSFNLSKHIQRIRESIETDPELAVGSTKEMLESVMKTVLMSFGDGDCKEDLPKLLKKVQKNLKLDPSEIHESVKGAEIVRRILSNLGQVVTGIYELRNIYGTGHGKIRNSGISPRHARLVVGVGAALASFLIETNEIRTAPPEKN
ncbi:abortive infection family protein [Solidesulfovibrio magneticus]|uniref:Abortive infection protein-like C-terminal domain-containing protein n=1 Tax=Solidesulfovibrio magneticus (strain ATCC 700980 / DSM 13731 / RS-1) TaxID=573370 RepID=C4XJE7_SOLM1|nr:abortive infection family protein [Solidesulfovibrio magneticus]BAH76697.1 hypothetical protein DMR_32060 [Solidesulfovibrio magneticus RS-1]